MPRFNESAGRDSARLQIRKGELPRSRREDPSGPIEAREPDELFDVTDEMIDPGESAARVGSGPVIVTPGPPKG